MKLESTNERDEVIAVQLYSKSKLERDPSAANVTTKKEEKAIFKKMVLSSLCTWKEVHSIQGNVCITFQIQVNAINYHISFTHLKVYEAINSPQQIQASIKNTTSRKYILQ